MREHDDVIILKELDLTYIVSTELQGSKFQF